MSCKYTKIKCKLWKEKSNRICYLCGKEVTFYNSNIDHVIPKSKGGKSNYINLRIVHIECNAKKSDLLPSEYGAAITIGTSKLYKFCKSKKKKQLENTHIRLGEFERLMSNSVPYIQRDGI